MRKRGNGEGTFFYNEQRGCWVGQKYIDGKRRSVTGKRKKDCEDKLKELERAAALQTPAGAGKLTLGFLIESKIEDDFEINLICANTKKTRMDSLTVINAHGIGKKAIQKITEADLKAFFKSVKHYSNSRINKLYQPIKWAFTYALNRGIIQRNPFLDIVKPLSDKDDKKVTALTVDEQRRLIEVLNGPARDNAYRCQFLLILATGMRPGEVNALTLKDVNFTFNTITVLKTVSRDENGKACIKNKTKTASGMRTLRMTSMARELLQDYIQNEYRPNPEQLLFIGHGKRKVIASAQMNDSFTRLVERFDIVPLRRVPTPLPTKRAFKEYTYMRRLKDGTFKKMKDKPADWETHFSRYYYTAFVPEKSYNQHMLRHTFATRCLESGVDYKTLSETLGHADITVTLNTYCDVMGEFHDRQMDLIEKSQEAFTTKEKKAERKA